MHKRQAILLSFSTFGVWKLASQSSHCTRAPLMFVTTFDEKDYRFCVVGSQIVS